MRTTGKHAARRSVGSTTTLDLTFAILAALLLVLACTATGGRVPAGVFFGIPLLLVQAIVGAVRIALGVTRKPSRNKLPRPISAFARLGPFMTMAAIAVSLLTHSGGC